LVRVKTLAAAKHGKDVNSLSLPLYVMTSDATREPSQKFFF